MAELTLESALEQADAHIVRANAIPTGEITEQTILLDDPDGIGDDDDEDDDDEDDE